MNAMLLENLRLLESKGFTELAEQLRHFTPLSKLQGSLETGDLNFAIGPNKLMYEPDVLASISEEVSNFAQKPTRIYLPDCLAEVKEVEGSPEWDMVGKLNHNKFNNAVREDLSQIEIIDNVAQGGGYMVSFGVGLGIQFAMYLDNFPMRNLILVEPVLEMLYHSFSTINWAGFFQQIEERGGEIKFITHPDPIMAGSEIVHSLRGRDFSLVDGSYVTQHYNSEYFEQALQSFEASVSILYHGMGFVEDEIKMYENGCGNLLSYDWRVLPADSPPAPLPYPAFIIGAGPSLDKTIKTIKENKEKAFLFSGGTALSALFENDIIPDFHCEAENTLYTHHILKNLDPEKLKQVTLIATNTVNPEIASWFKDVIFCIRDSVTPTRLFHDQKEIIPFAAANVSCLTNRAAMALGFQKLICFGMDFGSVKPEKHHSSSSVYNTSDDAFYKKGLHMAKFGIEVEGQKRAKVYTNTTFNYARQFLEQLFIHANGFEIYNTADGAKIHGAQSLDIQQIQLQQPFRSKGDILEGIYQRMPSQEKGCGFNPDHADEFETKLKTQVSNLEDLITNASDLEDLYQKIHFAIQNGHNDIEHGMDAALRVLMSGTFIQIIQTLDWVKKRISQDDWDSNWSVLRDETLQSLRLMKTDINAMFDKVNSFRQ